MKKSAFFDFLNRRENGDFDRFLRNAIEDEDYINWNEFVLPNDYGDAEAEYRSIRNSCAIFDVSPLRKFRIRGAGTRVFLDRLLTRPVSKTPSMRGTYVIFCNADGSLKDDAILYKFADDDYLLMPSDIDHTRYFESLRKDLKLDRNELSIIDCTDAWVGVAVQGPLSAAVLLNMGYQGIEGLKPFEMRDYPLSEGTVRVARMGFTADLGYECWFTPALIGVFEQSIRSARLSMGIDIPGYGLTALDVCRLEGGFVVAGWDFATEADPAPGFERSPFEVGLGWLVRLDGADFVGRDALLLQKKNGLRYTLRILEIDDPRKPEDGAELHAKINGRECIVGQVNCSRWSWGLERIIGTASIETQYVETGEFWTLMGGERLVVKLSRGPLLDLPRRNEVPPGLKACDHPD